MLGSVLKVSDFHTHTNKCTLSMLSNAVDTGVTWFHIGGNACVIVNKTGLYKHLRTSFLDLVPYSNISSS